MKKYTFITGILIIALMFSSCMINGEVGNGNVVSEARPVQQNFNRIHASRGVEVRLIYGEQPAIKVEADENLIDLITTEIDHNMLNISVKENIAHATKMNVYVNVHDLDQLKVTSGATIRSENTLQAKKLELKATSGGDIILDIFASEIDAKSTSGAGIRLSGKAGELIAEATSGSTIKALELEAFNADVHASSGADIKLFVSKKLNATASSGGSIRYKGNPQRTSHASVSGSVRKID